MTASAKCFTRENDCVTREIAGETIIVPIRNRVGDLDSIYTLNEVGTMIWQLIDGLKSIDEIVEAIHQTYDVKPEEAAKDAVEFLTSLEQAGLIKEYEQRSL
jgi:hypothetical protein